MPNRRLTAGVVLFTAALWWPSASLANCSDALRLQDMMAAYVALLADQSAPAAQSYARAILIYPEDAFAGHVKEIQNAVESARTLALQAVGRMPADPVTDAQAQAHLERVGDIASAIQSEDCTPAAEDRKNDEKSADPAAQSILGTGERLRLTSFRLAPSSPWVMALVIVTPVLLGATLQAVCRWKPRTKRQFQRHPIHHRLRVRSADRQAWETWTAIEISSGGMKLALEREMLPNTPVWIDLLGDPVTATVAWSNPHYAGLKFRQPLAPEVRTSILETQNADLSMAENENGASEETPPAHQGQ